MLCFYFDAQLEGVSMTSQYLYFRGGRESVTTFTMVGTVPYLCLKERCKEG